MITRYEPLDLQVLFCHTRGLETRNALERKGKEATSHV